ncbi:hypothetical protein CWB96_00400 [Pseudoalteromonas citrea]|uniref:Uncharacterized protein n=1 Tax=Pseudoalteromonas citrea TaxID=43655 RepID=A0A5S3XVG7_9GAMM|nr:phage tail protein [Pseudoalteromonas citrea]TMP46327.1 hypothetical protein CWB97_02395 [Pseudoalteromonas citrea]TMP63103.1 hypothetical protein CWB96_00400 [Pseudoalteromonas citrea]
MKESFIDIQGLVPEKLRHEPLFKDVTDALEHIYYTRKNHVKSHLDAIRDKYATYLVLAKKSEFDEFHIQAAPTITTIEPTVFMDEPLIKRETVELSFGTGTHQFITKAASLLPISEIIAGDAVANITQITPHQPHMLKGYFEENVLYEITCRAPVRFEYSGLAHGHPLPISRIECVTLGVVYDYFDLRNSDLYALEPGFKYQVTPISEKVEWVIPGKIYTQQDLDLSQQRNTHVISEFGYQYLIDALGMTPLDVALLRSFITTIHQLKGSRKGVDLMIDLLGLRDYLQIYEWWEDDPDGLTVEPMSYRLEADIRDHSVLVNNKALQALRLFLRQYVYPVMNDFGLLINFVDEQLRTGYNILTHQTLAGSIDSPLVVGMHVQPNQSITGDIASPIVLDVRGLLEREYKANLSSVEQNISYQLAKSELKTAVNVLPFLDIEGATSTQVLIGMAGVTQRRVQTNSCSPITTCIYGLVEQNMFGQLRSSDQSISCSLDLNISTAAQGFVKHTLHGITQSPVMLMVAGQLEREFNGVFNG